MKKLRLGPIQDDKPVRLKVELPAATYRDLVAYGEAVGREAETAAVDPSNLVGPMLEKFIASDRAFAKIRRAIPVGEI